MALKVTLTLLTLLYVLSTCIVLLTKNVLGECEGLCDCNDTCYCTEMEYTCHGSLYVKEEGWPLKNLWTKKGEGLRSCEDFTYRESELHRIANELCDIDDGEVNPASWKKGVRRWCGGKPDVPTKEGCECGNWYGPMLNANEYGQNEQSGCNQGVCTKCVQSNVPLPDTPEVWTEAINTETEYNNLPAIIKNICIDNNECNGDNLKWCGGERPSPREKCGDRTGCLFENDVVYLCGKEYCNLFENTIWCGV